jgi:hypothetical protein
LRALLEAFFGRTRVAVDRQFIIAVTKAIAVGSRFICRSKIQRPDRFVFLEDLFEHTFAMLAAFEQRAERSHVQVVIFRE